MFCGHFQFLAFNAGSKIKRGPLQRVIFTPLCGTLTNGPPLDGTPTSFTVNPTHASITPSLWIPNWTETWIARSFSALWYCHSCTECFLSNFCYVVFFTLYFILNGFVTFFTEEVCGMNSNVAFCLRIMETHFSPTQFAIYNLTNE
jgi:hypothetical protein